MWSKGASTKNKIKKKVQALVPWGTPEGTAGVKWIFWFSDITYYCNLPLKVNLVHLDHVQNV